MSVRPGAASRADDLARVRAALLGAATVVGDFDPERTGVAYNAHRSPVTDADLAVDAWLRRALPHPDEGWLSEESADDRTRLDRHRVWVVDPIDGTREFMENVPEWCISIALVEAGVAVAGGVYNPRRDELFLGARETGVTLNDRPVRVSGRTSLAGATVLVNRWALGKRTGKARCSVGDSPCDRSGRSRTAWRSSRPVAATRRGADHRSGSGTSRPASLWSSRRADMPRTGAATRCGSTAGLRSVPEC